MTNVINSATNFGYPFSSACKPSETHLSMKWDKGNRPVINIPNGIEYSPVKANRDGEIFEVENLSDYFMGANLSGIILKNIQVSVKVGEPNTYNGFGAFFEGGKPYINMKAGEGSIAIFDGNVSSKFVGKKGRFIPTSNGGGQGITIVLL